MKKAYTRVIKISDFPKNSNHFLRLKFFCKEILEACNEVKIKPIAYGSLAFFAYTRNKNWKVNDIDLLIPESGFMKVIPMLKKKRIKYDYSKEWHTLGIMKGNLKIEFDSKDYWQRNLPKKFVMLDFGDLKITAVNKNTLTTIYKKASEVSKDNPEGNRRKYEVLKKLQE